MLFFLISLFISRVSVWWKYYVMYYRTSSQPCVQCLFDGSLKLAMVGVFAPQKLANTRNQGLIYCFVDCLEQRPVNYSLWPNPAHCLFCTAYCELTSSHCELQTPSWASSLCLVSPSVPSTCFPGWWPHFTTAQDPRWLPPTHWKLCCWKLLNTKQ